MSNRNLNEVDRKKEELSITMRFFIFLTLLLTLVSCGGEDSEEIEEITQGAFDETLQPGTYRITPDDFKESASRLQSVYISSSDNDDVFDILRIKFDPQPWIRTEDDESVIVSGEEIFVAIRSGPRVLTEELGTATHNVIEYDGVAISNRKRPHIIFTPSPPVSVLVPVPGPVIVESNGDED